MKRRLAGTIGVVIAAALSAGCGDEENPFVYDPWDNIFRVDDCFGEEKVMISVTGDFPGVEPGEEDVRPGSEVSYRVSDGEEYRVRIYDLAGATLQDTVVTGQGYPVDCPGTADCTHKHVIRCRE